jgi:hypothetical protein
MLRVQTKLTRYLHHFYEAVMKLPTATEGGTVYSHFLLLVGNVCWTESRQHQQRHLLTSYFLKNMKHKNLIKIPLYYIDTLTSVTVETGGKFKFDSFSAKPSKSGRMLYFRSESFCFWLLLPVDSAPPVIFTISDDSCSGDVIGVAVLLLLLCEPPMFFVVFFFNFFVELKKDTRLSWSKIQ